MSPADRLAAVTLDAESFPPTGTDLDNERQVAVRDLVEKNVFRPAGAEGEGPWRLTLSLADRRLGFAMEGPGFSRTHGLSMTPLKTVMRDYLMICESYHQVMAGTDAGKIEAIDMGRRGLHNEGADALRARLSGKAEMDHETARRLFTLVCALLRKG